MASTVAFEINKVTLKLRRSLHFSPAPTRKSLRKERKTEEVASTQSTSRGAQKNRQLCAELSSFALYPLFGALTPSHFSSPNLLFQNEKKKIMNLLDLTDELMSMIIKLLDAKSMLSLSQTNRKIRRICLFNEPFFKKRRDVSSHEIVISFNQIKRKTDVRLLKKNRTRNDEIFIGNKIQNILAPFSRNLTKITFESGIFLSDWMNEILELYNSNKLIPLSFSFTGGSLTKANHLNGSDLRCVTEGEFIDFVSRLQPHLQEVQLQTSRLFKISSSPPRLLGLISMLSSFGIVYERPPLRFFFDEIVKIISFWKNDVLSRSCDVHIRRPRDASFENWKKIGFIDESREDPYTGEILVSKITIKHSFLVHIDLIFHFH